MSGRTDNLVNLLEQFGLSADEALVYLEMMAKGAMSALQISRGLRMGRTMVYRILDKLLAMELAVQEYDEAGFKFVASEPAKLELMVARKEGEAAALRQALPSVQAALSRRAGASAPGSKVLFYRGKRGLSQVNWNLTRARGVLCSYEVATADVYMPKNEAEKLRRELVKQKILVRTMMNTKHIKPFTKVKEMVRDWWEIRRLDPKVLEIKADMFIYNDVYAVCHYLQDGDVFCVEMVNETISRMQRQMFKALWRQAVPMKKVGEEGEVGLDNSNLKAHKSKLNE